MRSTVTGNVFAVPSLLHDEHEAALLSRDDRGGRHDQGVRVLVEADSRIDELARPERAVRIGERALEQDGAGRRIHGVVHEGQHPFAHRAAPAISSTTTPCRATDGSACTTGSPSRWRWMRPRFDAGTANRTSIGRI